VSLIRRHPLWTLIAVGVVVRLVLAFAWYGTLAIDVLAFTAEEAQAGDLEGVYEEGGFNSWPYPPLYIAWLVVADGLSDAFGLSFHGVVQVLPILADVALGMLAYAYLGWRGASDGQRLAAAALVLLGPAFIAPSGYQGQIDSVAILPAALAVAAWELRPARTRAVESGLLIGLGAAIKIVPGLVAVPLIACSRSWREGARFAVAALALPVITLAPLALSGIELNRVTDYGGVGGFGGLSLIADPALGWDLIKGGIPTADGVSEALSEGSRWITAALLVGLAAFLFRYRPAPLEGCVLLWLAVFAFSPNFFLSYLVWALPFFIMAGYLRETAILQAAVLPATVVYYLAIGERVHGDVLAAIYVASMVALWVFWVVALFVVGRRIVRARDAADRAPILRPDGHQADREAGRG
jgi:Glycosyltransferase family 87